MIKIEVNDKQASMLKDGLTLLEIELNKRPYSDETIKEYFMIKKLKEIIEEEWLKIPF